MSNIWKKNIPQGNCEEPLEDISVSMVAWGGRLLLSAVDKDPSIERVEQGQSDRRVNLGSVCELMHSFPLSWDISAACPHALNSEQDLCPLCPLLTLPQAFVQTELYDFPFLSFSFFSFLFSLQKPDHGTSMQCQSLNKLPCTCFIIWFSYIHSP